MSKQQIQTQYSFGIDVGSTTVKLVVTDDGGGRVYAKYQRHFADVRKTLLDMLQEVYQQMGDVQGTFAITGSGGLNLAGHIGIAFIQEVIAVTSAIRAAAPQTDVVIELGGEDAKIIFLTGGVEQRMNGICAGGTGAFIDQMAALLQTDAAGLNEYAKGYRELYPIAARCGVFAKTDIQPLINDGVPREDLAASIFQAVVTQTISGLACGRRIRGHVAFLGGPLYFLSELREAFIRTLHLTPEQAIFPQDAHLFAASGAAVYSSRTEARSLTDVLEKLASVDGSLSEMHCLPPLFEDEAAYQVFRERQSAYRIARRDLSTYEGDCFLGIDAGSTTMKLVLLSENGELLHSYYGSNKGDPLAVCRQAMGEIRAKMNPGARIARACSTGYGETLLKDAFCLDEGEVETISHYYAARFFQPDVDCILDIGGQDMKCMKIKDGCVDTIILNEACSSGCGSFIENFANSLGYTAQEFAQKALFARKPVDLGTRCTIFMNSNVKQAQKEGATVEDIAAGLAYSVIKNALFKVIKLTDPASLGNHIVVQGGTFYNDAILRGFELVSEREAIRPDIAGLMGAFGAALIARERYTGEPSATLPLEDICALTWKSTTARCQGCNNHCMLTVNRFPGGRTHITGNRCEKGLGKGETTEKGINVAAYKLHRLFDYQPLEKENAPRGEIGIPRVLNMWENYPFWFTFLTKLGFSVKVSPASTRAIYQLGMESIPSESECYPAKLAHGHVQWLIDQGVKVIFHPCVFYEHQETPGAQNHYNCPMVCAYPENLKNNVEDVVDGKVQYIRPFIALTSEQIAADRLVRLCRDEWGIDAAEVRAAEAARAEAEAKQAADDIGIEHYVFDMQALFREKVIESFAGMYKSGRTPNPCVECNRYLKFPAFWQAAADCGADFMATGHYVQLQRSAATGKLELFKGRDDRKDQSYMLYHLDQGILEHCIFPLGGYLKEEVRNMAAELGLRSAGKAESQDICFVPDGDYSSFLERLSGKSMPEGDIVDSLGNVLGRHKGICSYTVGQRKGLKIARGEPLFVLDIDGARNEVIVGAANEVFSDGLVAEGISWIDGETLKKEIRAEVKIRYSRSSAAARILPAGNNQVRVLFDQPQRAVTRGQSAVFYAGSRLLGGGIISGRIIGRD